MKGQWEVWAHLNGRGRGAMRRWYKTYRRNGRDRTQTREIIKAMVHANYMGDYWSAID